MVLDVYRFEDAYLGAIRGLVKLYNSTETNTPELYNPV